MRLDGMKRDEILELFRSLSRSQGFYGRLLQEITDEQLDYLEEQKFKDPVELILFLEG